MPMIWYNHVNI